MNFLSYNIFKHYKAIGVSIIDIGHSTEDSIPNQGLCEFKESIGCSIDLQYEFYFYLQKCKVPFLGSNNGSGVRNERPLLTFVSLLLT